MTDFEQKILNSLKNNKTDNLLNYLSSVQNNLLKNYSNPAFNKNDKNKLLEKYSLIKQVGEAIYKHNKYLENGMQQNANVESEEVSEILLKGGISNCRYIWHSEHGENTCEKCLSLDGTVYDFEDEVPERPHPNCQCYIEIVEDFNDNKTDEKDDEPCDCYEKLILWKTECESACNEAEQLNSEFSDTLNTLYEIEDSIISYPLNSIKENIIEIFNLVSEKINEIKDAIEQITGSINIFYSNWHNLIELNNELGSYLDQSAEYYHTKANCQSAQLGDVGEKTAELLGYIREMIDIPKEILFKGYSIQRAFENSIHDLEVNKKGRELGRNYPNEKAEDIIEQPKRMPPEYR